MNDEPKCFDSCPVCGSEERLAMNKINELKEQGVINKDSFIYGPVMQVALLDPTRPPSILAQTMTMRVLLVYWDTCGGCGINYCTRFEYVEQQVPVQFQNQAGKQFNPLGLPPTNPIGN